MFCWRSRLRFCAELAKARGFAGFTSSLLYSRYQKHEVIRGLGVSMAEDLGLAFVYEDFRALWQRGILLSKEWGIYRQQYCGCLFSEYERYSREFAKAAGASDGAAFGTAGKPCPGPDGASSGISGRALKGPCPAASGEGAQGGA